MGVLMIKFIKLLIIKKLSDVESFNKRNIFLEAGQPQRNFFLLSYFDKLILTLKLLFCQQKFFALIIVTLIPVIFIMGVK